MNTKTYDDIADWYNELRSDDSISIVDDLTYPYIFDLITLNQSKSQPYICDLACGQGKLSRNLARKGVKVLGVDISMNLVKMAQDYENEKPLGVNYIQDNAETLSKLKDNQFDGVVCQMALMDIANLEMTFSTVFRILKEDGWFVFTIMHPCFESPYAKSKKENDNLQIREIYEYFEDRFWISKNPNGIRGQVGAYHRKLSTYINTLISKGFTITSVVEPQEELEITDSVLVPSIVPSFMLIQSRKQL